MALAGDDLAAQISANASILGHFHLSMPWLMGFNTADYDPAPAVSTDKLASPSKKRKAGADEVKDKTEDQLKKLYVDHKGAAAAMEEVKGVYSGLLSIEKRNHGDNSVKMMREAIEFAQSTYASMFAKK